MIPPTPTPERIRRLLQERSALQDQIGDLKRQVSVLEKQFVDAYCPVKLGDIIEDNLIRIVVVEIHPIVEHLKEREWVTYACRGWVLRKDNRRNPRYSGHHEIQFTKLDTPDSRVKIVQRIDE